MSNRIDAARVLPDRPNLQHLKNQARDLVRDGSCPSLSEALFRLARAYGFVSWPKLKAHIASLSEAGLLREAIDGDDLRSAQLLLQKNAALRAAPIGYAKDGPLTWAAECRVPGGPPSAERLSIASWLIDDGADVHEGGDAPLMRAALNGERVSMMELLVNKGADVNAAWHGNYPILFVPCETLNPASLEWLLQQGADPNCGDEDSWRRKGLRHPGTALDYLLGTYLRDPEALRTCIDLLLRAGGQTKHRQPAVLAVIQDDAEALRGLLQAEAALLHERFESLDFGTTAARMLTLRGGTLLHVAAEFGSVETARWLIENGADVNGVASFDPSGIGGQTAIFHAATQNGDLGLPMVQLLVSRGADLAIRCRLPGHYERPGEVIEVTPLQYALLFPGGENRTVAFLKEHGAA